MDTTIINAIESNDVVNQERIRNEVNALKLISRRTTIPVPRLLDHGTHQDGRQYLVTELVQGEALDSFHDMPCSKPTNESHTMDTPCTTCLKQAYGNALTFVNETVLPRLAAPRSNERSLDCFVMPPSWLCPDMDPPWVGKASWKTLLLKTADYVFQHGDLAAHNILIDPSTLKVTSIIDWEYAGFYPPGMDLWPGSLDDDTYRARAKKPAAAIARFLPEDYLECYEKWGDKSRLLKPIEEGEIPHPHRCQ
ncbi:hypothetical protein NLG97_g2404 [Lecanicillium saksenae]|uniref:Uncharacterized protein n=1 Tax=Lecanicillium saksenae TaxID=468837 RepID=A0ACC1R2V9_9HYPO|nr:hypothetical protein NLG97_g2404 [Lecanicillium saksenae]